MATTLTGTASVWSCHEVAWAVAAGEPPRQFHPSWRTCTCWDIWDRACQCIGLTFVILPAGGAVP